MEGTEQKVLEMDGFLTGYNVSATSFTDTGQFGFTPNHRAWGHLGLQTKENLVIMVLDYPRGFDDLPNPEKWIEAFNAIMTDLPSITEGFNWTQTPEFNEVEVGGTGDMHHTPAGMKFTPTEISTALTDRMGYVIEKFVKGWWDHLLMEVDTKRPAVTALPGNEKKEFIFSDDYRGGVIIAFEPDVAMRRVNKAQIVYNVMPKDGLESTGKRDLNATKELAQYTLTWTGTAVRDKGALQVAQMLLDLLVSNSVIASNRSAIVTEINQRVAELKTGLLASMQQSATEQL